MEGNRSSQSAGASGRKTRASGASFARGKIWYIRFSEGGGKVRVEAVGPSEALAIKVCAKRRTEVAERRFFPASGVRLRRSSTTPLNARETDSRSTTRKSIQGRQLRHRERLVPQARRRQPDHLGNCREAERPHECLATFNRFRVAISHAYKIAPRNKRRRRIQGAREDARRKKRRMRYLNEFSPPRGKGEETRLVNPSANCTPTRNRRSISPSTPA